MKRIALAVGTLLLILGLTAGVSAAASNVSVSGNNNRTLYKFGKSVNIGGTVNGDIFCAGQTVSVDAVVNGDVICAAQTITVNGMINGNVRLAGQTVNLGAQVAGNASLAGQDIHLNSGGRIGRDAGIAGQTVSIDGPVGRDLNAAAQDVTINNIIGRNVEATVNKLSLINNSKIGGNLNYTSNNHLFKDPGATIAGQISYHQPEKKETGGFNWLFRLLFILAKIIIGVVFVALLPQLFRNWNEVGVARWPAALLIGFIAMFAIPVIIIVLMSTVIGIPLGIFLILAWLAALFFSMVLSMYFVGSRIVPRWHPVLLIIVGAVVLGILEVLPYIGFIFILLAFWYGTGALLINLRRAYRRPRYT